MARIAVNGIHLNVEERGAGPALLLLHGFTGSAATWEPFGEAWTDYRTIAVDLIGHGESDASADPGRYSMDACCLDLAALLDRLGVGRAAVLGYSLGGRVALRFALQHPERLWALVLESASPGIDDPAERAERVRSDQALAAKIEAEGMEAFVAYWEALPLWASQARLPAAVRDEQRRRRLANSPTGLANSLRGMGAGADPPVMERLGEVAAPALVIAGGLDEKYRALATAMAARLPAAEAKIVEDAGHAVHVEEPALFGESVSEFLARCRDLVEARRR